MQSSLLAQPQLELTLQTDLEDILLASPSVREIIQLPWSSWGECWLATLTETLPAASGYELTLLLTDNTHIQRLNAQFRHQDSPTDVLAFATLEVDLPRSPVTGGTMDEPEPLYLGDIVISLERAAQQAHDRGHDFSLEVIWLFTHGLLHLLGWDHPDEATLTAMLSQQSQLLTLIGRHPPQFI